MGGQRHLQLHVMPFTVYRRIRSSPHTVGSQSTYVWGCPSAILLECVWIGLNWLALEKILDILNCM